METLEEIKARHRKEVRAKTDEVTALKKLITQGDKKKKKEVNKQIHDLEADLKARHAEELANCGTAAAVKKPEAEKLDDEEDDDDNDDEAAAAERLLAELELEELDAKLAEKKAQKQTQNAPSQPGAKRNRRKEKLAQRAQEMREMEEEAAEEAKHQPDLRKMELDNIEALCKIQGVVQYDIKPDGHCLFASIADQLKLRHDVQPSVQDLRTSAATYIRAHPDLFGPFLFDEKTLSMREIEPYCAELESKPIWGGDMEILALAKVYGCPVSVMISGASAVRINEDASKPELKLVYYKHSFGLGEHYNSLRDAVAA